LNYKPFNSTAGYSIGITQSTVIDGSGNITGATATFSGLGSFSVGISAAGGTFSALTRFTAGISASSGMTLAGSFQGSTATFSGLGSFSVGISAAGGTFSAPIKSTRLARLTSAVFEAKSANWTPTNADDGKIFTVDIHAKSTITCTLSGLSTGIHFKILVLSGTVLIETGDDLYGYNDVGTGDTRTIYCIGSGTYFGSI